MKTIVEIINGEVYVYRNTEKHFKKIEKSLTGRRILPGQLDEECHISDNSCHIIIDGDVK